MRLQDLYFFCVDDPKHGRPPHLGAGWVQVLSLTISLLPLPHLFEQAPIGFHRPQPLQLPLTVKKSSYRHVMQVYIIMIPVWGNFINTYAIEVHQKPKLTDFLASSQVKVACFTGWDVPWEYAGLHALEDHCSEEPRQGRPPCVGLVHVLVLYIPWRPIHSSPAPVQPPLFLQELQLLHFPFTGDYF